MKVKAKASSWVKEKSRYRTSQLSQCAHGSCISSYPESRNLLPARTTTVRMRCWLLLLDVAICCRASDSLYRHEAALRWLHLDGTHVGRSVSVVPQIKVDKVGVDAMGRKKEDRTMGGVKAG